MMCLTKSLSLSDQKFPLKETVIKPLFYSAAVTFKWVELFLGFLDWSTRLNSQYYFAQDENKCLRAHVIIF